MVCLLTKHRNKGIEIWHDEQRCVWLHHDKWNLNNRPRLLSSHIKSEHLSTAAGTDAEKAGAINRNLIPAVKLSQLCCLPQAIKSPRLNRNAAAATVAEAEKVEIVRWEFNANALAQR